MPHNVSHQRRGVDASDCMRLLYSLSQKLVANLNRTMFEGLNSDKFELYAFIELT